MSLELTVGLLLVAVGVPMSVRALRSRGRRLALLRDCVRVQGRVVRFQDSEESGSTLSEATTLATSSAIVEYRDKQNRRHELQLPAQSHHGRLRVGAVKPVYFERGRPKNATCVHGAWDVNVVAGLCLAVLAIGAGLLFTAWQDAQ